jgi:hypothetical protein
LAVVDEVRSTIIDKTGWHYAATAAPGMPDIGYSLIGLRERMFPSPVVGCSLDSLIHRRAVAPQNF